MSRIAPSFWRGLIVPSDLIWVDTLAYNEVTSLGRSYTETAGVPGAAVSSDAFTEFSPRLSGDLSGDLVVTGVASGFARAPGGRVGWREAADTYVDGSTAEVGPGADRGWNPPNVITGFVGIDIVTPTDTYGHYGAAVVPSTQSLVAVYTQTAGGASRYCVSYNPASDECSARYTFDDLARAGNPGFNAVLVIPETERVIVFAVNSDIRYVAYYSDDGGATWATYAMDYLPETKPSTSDEITRARAYYDPISRLVSLHLMAMGTGKIFQYVSDSLGSTFEHVCTHTPASVSSADVTQALDGRLLLHWADGGTNIWQVTAPTARDAWDTIDPTLVAVSSDTGLVSCVDVDGIAWLYTDDGTEVHLLRSIDLTSWESCAFTAYHTSGGTVAAMTPAISVCVPCNGSIAMVGGFSTATNDYGPSVVATFFGGWDSWQYDAQNDYAGDVDVRRFGGWNSSYTTAVCTFLPFDEPESVSAWTRTLTGAPVQAVAEGVDKGYYSITCAADVLSWSHSTGTAECAVAEIILRVTSGGSLTSDDIALTLRIANSTTFDHRISLRWTGTQIRIRDEVAGSVLDTVNLDSSGEFVHVRACLRWTAGASRVEVFARGCSTGKRKSKLIYAGTVSNKVVKAATGICEWGTIVSATCAYSVRYVHVMALAGAGADTSSAWVSPMSDPTPGSYGTGHYGRIGRYITITPTPIGLDGVHIWGEGGPLRYGETFDVPVQSEFGHQNMHWQNSPSPSQEWRSTSDSSACIFAFEFDAEQLLDGYSIGLALRGINFRTAYLEYYDGAAWQTAGTFDAAEGHSGLAVTQVGAICTPTASGSTASRFLHDSEFVGGYLSFSAGMVRKIELQTAGVWTDSTTVKPIVRVELQEGDATSGTYTGCRLWASGGVLVVHRMETPRIAWRVRIPSQTTAEGYFRIGSMLLGAFVVLGKQWSRGWALESAGRCDLIEDLSGAIHGVQRGPNARTWSFAWPDGVQRRGMQGAQPTPDYYAYNSSANPVAAHMDVATLLEGLQNRLNGGAKPCAVLRSVQTNALTKMITDRNLWMVGFLSSSVRVEHIDGPEDSTDGTRSGELLRVAQVTFTEST